MSSQNHQPLVIFANREPYIHEHGPTGVELHRPASGLISALEPVIQKKGGLWIAHGSGSADKEHSNHDGTLEVPPHEKSYLLKRVWLTPAEKKGYYDGFSNEALWPLFHLAYQQPIFRRSDWEYYVRINERFSGSLDLSKIKHHPAILVQDFHLALVPALLRESLKNSGLKTTIGLVWHIPWVPEEVFRICPWASEILRGMLGADLISFHTPSYCHNFLLTCQKILNCQINPKSSSITYRDHTIRVRSIPIGIDPAPSKPINKNELRTQISQELGFRYEVLGLGIDRLDYTKGIPERLQAIDGFLDQNPHFIGHFCFLQIAPETRPGLPSYQRFSEKILSETTRINLKYLSKIQELFPGSNDTDVEARLPIRLITKYQDWTKINLLYQAADFCIVSSLHDGMNLVAKEYVWSKSDHSGALILSKFTGASDELNEAFLINPYHEDDIISAIQQSLSADSEEKRCRMKKMRTKVLTQTAQTWADQLLLALANPQYY